MCETGLTRFQVAELGQRPHLQMLQVKRVSLPAGQIPHNMFIDHAHTSELHQCTKQQRDLREFTLVLHSVHNDVQTGVRHTKSITRDTGGVFLCYLCFIDAFDVRGREVCVDLIDVLLVHVLWYTVLIKVVHHVGARQHAVHLKTNNLLKLIW